MTTSDNNSLSLLSVEMLDTVERGFFLLSVGVRAGCFFGTSVLPFRSRVSVVLLPLLLGGFVAEILRGLGAREGELDCPWSGRFGMHDKMERRKATKRELSIT